MTKKERILRELSLGLSYVLVAALAVVITLALTVGAPYLGTGRFTKLEQLQQLLEDQYIDIDKVDISKLEDAAANAMVEALGDRWSYYLSAEEYAELMEQNSNSYVGIGVSIEARAEMDGVEIVRVEPNSSAQKAGILPGDILIEIDGKSLLGRDADYCRELVRGKAGTTLSVKVLREGKTYDYILTRQVIHIVVAEGQMLQGNIGLVTIANFDERCYSETKAAIKKLVDEGAKALVFDVRFNPGGYKQEMVKILDVLLPEGVLFRSVDYAGISAVDRSDAACLELPMAVVVNGESYSAAEFFAAALREYDWATVVGTQTCGKGNFQYTYQFTDGSGVGLSVGKYYTPNGVSLADQGGLTPDVVVEVDEETAVLIYAGLIKPEEDPQIQAAVQALQSKLN